MGTGKKERDSIELEELEQLEHSVDDAGSDEGHDVRKSSFSSISDGDFDDAPEASGKEVISQVEEHAVVRKLDRRLVLFVALLYMLSFLDRSSKSHDHRPSPKGRR